MSRPRPAALALIALSLASCGETGARVEVPAEGTIVLHSEARASRTPGRRLAATTIIFTTASAELEAEPDQGLEVTVGTRSGEAPPVRSMTSVAQGTAKPAARVLDAESFARLWRNLEAAGLFSLPRYPGGRPPEDRDYILVKTGEGQAVYTTPSPPSSGDRENATRLLESWRNSKIAIASFLNE